MENPGLSLQNKESMDDGDSEFDGQEFIEDKKQIKFFPSQI